MRLPDRLWVPALAAGLLALAFVGLLLVRADGDPSLLVHAGPPWSTATGARSSLTIQPADEAFDGQFFYRLGVSPWSRAPRVAGVRFDLPALRNGRWGYGAMAFAASGGDPDVVPWALIGLNVVAAAAVGAIGGGLARASGRHVGWGLMLLLWPGFAYSLSLDTSELVASGFALGAILALRHRRWWGAAALFTVAVLTRDTTAVIPFGMALAGAWTWWRARAATADDPGDTDRPAALRAVLAAGVALAAFGAWQLLQRARFGTLPMSSSGDNNLSAPFSGLVHELRHLVPPHGGDDGFRLLCVLGLAALIAGAAWCWRRSSASIGVRVAWVPALLVVALLNAYLWSGATAFLRATTEAGILSILVILGSGRERLIRLAGIGLAGLWLLTAASQVAKLG